MAFTSNFSTTSTSPTAPCPPGQHPSGAGCVGNLPGGGDSPQAPYYPDPQGSGGNVPPKLPPVVPRPPTTSVCPDGTPDGYADCCTPGPNGQRVWRSDTKTCEYEDDRQKAGQDTCRGTPITCPPGQTAWCDFTTAQFRCAVGGSGGGSGSAGAGGGGGVAGKSSAPILDPALGQSDTLWQSILARLHGDSRYSPEVMQGLAAQTKMESEQQARLQTEQSNADLASRGLARSGVAADQQAAIRMNVSGLNLAGWNQIQRAKIDADFQDKSEAIKEGMDWVNSLRDYVARSNATQAQKDAAMANVQLGYARLTQELEMMREQYGQQINLLLLGNQLGM